MKQQSERLGEEPVSKLLAELAIPATVGILVMALYNVVDTIYIARGVGTIGVAAVSIAFPVQMLVMAISAAIGIGGASFISRLLGAGRREKANRVFANVISLIMLVSISGALFALNMLDPILRLFGSSETIMPYARDYLGVILYGTFFFSFAFAVNNIVRAEGNARTAMFTMIVSAVLNVVFTPIFIFGFDMGIRGAALGTVVAQGITAIYLVMYYALGKSTLTFKFAYMPLSFSIIKSILAIGVSAFVRQGAASVMLVVANNLLIVYGGDLAIAVLGILIKVMMFSTMPIMGIVQGLLPIAGYNYGASHHERVSQSILLAMKAATVIAGIGFLTVMVFPGPIMHIFTDDPAAIEMGRIAMRMLFACSFTIGVQMVTGGVFQAVGKAKAAFVLSLSRQVLFLIPLMIILPMVLQLPGIWLAFPGADLLSFILAFLFIRRYDKLFPRIKIGNLIRSQA